MRDYFAERGIELLGRFAEFDYINSDEVMRRAIDMAERLNGQTDCTVREKDALAAATRLTDRDPTSHTPETVFPKH